MRPFERLNKIYDLLVTIGGAEEKWRESFIYAHTENDCQEWRFQGHLGFGGKYYSGKNRVGYDSTDKVRDKIVKKLNNKLSLIEPAQTPQIQVVTDNEVEKRIAKIIEERIKHIKHSGDDETLDIS